MSHLGFLPHARPANETVEASVTEKWRYSCLCLIDLTGGEFPIVAVVVIAVSPASLSGDFQRGAGLSVNLACQLPYPFAHAGVFIVRIPVPVCFDQHDAPFRYRKVPADRPRRQERDRRAAREVDRFFPEWHLLPDQPSSRLGMTFVDLEAEFPRIARFLTPARFDDTGIGDD